MNLKYRPSHSRRNRWAMLGVLNFSMMRIRHRERAKGSSYIQIKKTDQLEITIVSHQIVHSTVRKHHNQWWKFMKLHRNLCTKLFKDDDLEIKNIIIGHYKPSRTMEERMVCTNLWNMALGSLTINGRINGNCKYFSHLLPGFSKIFLWKS